MEKIAYGIAIPGFMMTSTLWVHIAAKFVSASEAATIPSVLSTYVDFAASGSHPAQFAALAEQ